MLLSNFLITVQIIQAAGVASGNEMVRKVAVNVGSLPDEVTPAQHGKTTAHALVRKAAANADEASKPSQNEYDSVRTITVDAGGLADEVMNPMQNVNASADGMVRKLAINAYGFPDEFNAAQESNIGGSALVRKVATNDAGGLSDELEALQRNRIGGSALVRKVAGNAAVAVGYSNLLQRRPSVFAVESPTAAPTPAPTQSPPPAALDIKGCLTIYDADAFEVIPGGLCGGTSSCRFPEYSMGSPHDLDKCKTFCAKSRECIGFSFHEPEKSCYVHVKATLDEDKCLKSGPNGDGKRNDGTPMNKWMSSTPCSGSTPEGAYGSNSWYCYKRMGPMPVLASPEAR